MKNEERGRGERERGRERERERKKSALIRLRDCVILSILLKGIWED